MKIPQEESCVLLSKITWHEHASIDEIVETALTDGMNIGICRECSKVIDVDLEETNGECPRCGQMAVVSVLVLSGKIHAPSE